MVGKVLAPSSKKVAVAWEDGQERTVSATDIQLAYCMTVHKAQGSEFDDVLVATFAVETMATVLDRRWIYTASTRAKNRLRISSGPGIDELVAMPIKRQGLTNLKFVA
jgi:ATP-dependent exoDNAse (exonuclease V) alpha subunit